MNPCWNKPGGQISILRDKSLLAFLIITISNKTMAKTKKKLVPTKKVEMEETKEAEMGIEPKIEPKEEKKLAEEKEAKIEAEEKIEAKRLADEKAKEDKAKDKEENGVYVVENKLNQFVREYTPEIHGDKRKALAEEFAKKIKGKVIIR